MLKGEEEGVEMYFNDCVVQFTIQAVEGAASHKQLL